jgi:hypothetical protein
MSGSILGQLNAVRRQLSEEAVDGKDFMYACSGIAY